MDAIALIKQDHQAVEALFLRFERAGDKALRLKRSLVDKMIVELSRHAAIEEQVLYPAARAALENAKDLVLEALEEHHVVKWILQELLDLKPDAERFDAKVTVLMENVRHHVAEEERELLPKLRKALPLARLREIGAKLEHAKRLAPTRPHPRSPDAPPGNLLVGPVAGAVDHGRRAVKSFSARAAVERKPRSRR